MSVKNIVKLSELAREARFDAEFYQPLYVAREASVARLSSSPLRGLAHTIKRGVQPQYDEDGTVPVIRTVNVRELALSSARQQYVTEAFSAANPRAHVRQGDIVVTSTGIGTLGRVAYVDADTDYFADGHIAYLRDIEGIDPLYLATFLQSAVGRSLIERRQRGSSGQLEVYTEDLESIPIPRMGAAESKVVDYRKAAILAARQANAATTVAEARLMQALELDRVDLSPQKCYTRSFGEICDEDRLDAEYFNPKYQRVIKKLRTGGLRLADVAPLTERRFCPALRPKGSSFRYIEIGSLTGDGEAEAETIDVADAPSRAAWIVKPGDIITSTVRPVRRLSALVGDAQDGCVCSSGFAVLSPNDGPAGLEPEVLLTYLRLPIVCEILDLHCTSSMYPAIPVDRLMRIPVTVPDANTRKAIVAKVREATSARREALQLIERAKKTVEDLIADAAGARSL